MIFIHPPRENKMQNTTKNRTRKVTISSRAKGLTAQAEMIPVVGFMNKQGFYNQLKKS